MSLAAMVRHAAILATAAVSVSACTKLGALNAIMPADPGAEAADSAVAYGEHPRQKLDIYTPKANDDAAPVVVFIYGGSWDSGRRQDYGFVGKALAAAGFITVIPDYRLVPEVRYPAFVNDSAAAVRWVHANIAKYGGAPSRIGVAGHSAGAYNAIMLATAPRFTDPNRKTALPIKAAAGLSGPYDFLPLDVAATKAAFAGVDDLTTTQPVNIITANGPPLFLAHGLADTLVLPRNTRALAEQARYLGRTVEITTYEGVDHVDMLLSLGRWFRDRAPALQDMTTFLHDALDVPRTVEARAVQ